MRLELLDPLLDDIGFNFDEERSATKNYCLGMLKVGDMTWGLMNIMAATFADGFVALRGGLTDKIDSANISA